MPQEAWARQAGLKTAAKVQVNTSWELASLPYLPVLDLVAEHCRNLAKANLDGMMLAWSLGGYPSPNLEVADRFSRMPVPTLDEALDRYGPLHESMRNLATYGRIRVLADRLGVESIDREGRDVVFKFRPQTKLDPVRLIGLVRRRRDLTLVPPSGPGTSGTPASRISSFACTLSPIRAITSAPGPMKTRSLSAHASTKAGFSERKP